MMDHRKTGDRLTRRQAARYLGLSPHTLEVWGTTGRYNLPFIKVGRVVQYRMADLDAFLERRTKRFDSGEAA